MLTQKKNAISLGNAIILKIDSKTEVNVQNLYTKESRKILKYNSQLRRPVLQLTEEKAAGFYFIPEFFTLSLGMAEPVEMCDRMDYHNLLQTGRRKRNTAKIPKYLPNIPKIDEGYCNR